LHNVLAHLTLTGSERRYWVKGYNYHKTKLGAVACYHCLWLPFIRSRKI